MVLFAVSLDPTKLFGSDFFNFLLPWVLTFVITYALLIQAKMFGSKNDKISLALSFVFAFFVTASAGPQLAGFFMTLFGNATIYIIGLLVLAMFLTLTTGKGLDEFVKGSWATLFFWGIVALSVVLFFSSGGAIPGLKLDNQTAMLIFWGAVALGAIYYVTGNKEGAKEAAAPAAEKTK